jgi:DNA-binding transcriptional LysR family regulator
MEFHQVRYFLAVCRTLHFTRAAEECNVTQPALSRAIQQLEAELGGPLFRRERSLTHMTNLANTVHPALSQCYEASQSAKALATAYHKGGQAPLNLALARSIEIELLQPVLSEIAGAFPNIEIKITRGPPVEIGERLKSGDVEVGVGGALVGEWDRFESRRLYEEQYGLLLSRKHRLAGRNVIEIADLAQERFLCRPHCWLAETVAGKLAGIGVRAVARHEVPLIEDLPGMVSANLGVGIWPIGRRIGDDLLVNKIGGVDMNRWIHLHTVAGRRHSVGAATFIKLLRVKDWMARPGAVAPASEVLH